MQMKHKRLLRLPQSRKLRIAAATLAAALLLLLCIAGIFLLRTSQVRPEPWSVDADTALTFQNSDAIVEQLQKSLTRHDYRIVLHFQAQGEYMADIHPLVNDLLDAAMSHSGNPIQGDYIRYQYGGYTLSYSHEPCDGGYTYTAEILPDYYTTLAQESQVDEAIDDILNDLHFTPFTSDLEKITAICRYVSENVTYDRVHQKNVGHHLKTTAYAALLQGAAVCQGYCVVMYRLLLEAGIDCRIITGTVTYENGETEYHSWNLVALDGKYYNLDVTWDVQEQSENYFMKSDATFSDHVRDAKYDTAEFREFYPMAEEDLTGS